MDGYSSSSISRLSSRDFDGPDCDEDPDCKRRCRDMFSRNASECQDLPEDMVDILFDHWENLKRIRSSLDSNSMNPAAIAAIIDIDERAILDLIDDWGPGDVESFLQWVAEDPRMIDILDEEDKDFTIFEEALLKVSDEQFRRSEADYGLTADINGYTETFLYKAFENKNDEAFEFVFDFLDLDSICPKSKKDCKSLVLCTREELQSRNRTYSDTPECPYFGQGPYYRRNKYCYIQGPNVWSYINSLLDEKDLKDTDLRSIDSLDEDYCEDFCKKNKNCERQDF